jgi:hypothetical protein
VTRTQAVYYRDSRGTESADEFIQALPPKRAAKIHDFVEEHLTGNPPGAPLPAFPITSQIEGESPRASSPVRKHSLLHPVQASENLVVLLYALEKDTRTVRKADIELR